MLKEKKNKVNYQMALSGFINNGYDLSFCQGYLTCLYANKLITLAKLYELNYEVEIDYKRMLK